MDAYEKKVPAVVIKRLPRYYRYLSELLNQGITRVSSGELSKKMGVTASQVRQDFNYFGGFGQQGYGYNIEYLLPEIEKILGLNKGYKTVIFGAGHLGHALANHTAFARRGFKLCAIFDINPELIGAKINGAIVLPEDCMEEYIRAHKIDIAILAVPKNVVQEIADKLAACGIKGIWNFSYAELKTKNSVAVENVHLTDSLMTLSYKITREKNNNEK